MSHVGQNGSHDKVAALGPAGPVVGGGGLPLGQPGSPGREPVARGADEGERRGAEVIEEPVKITRLGVMIRSLLEEVRAAPLDEASRNRLRKIHSMSIEELAKGLSPDLRDELNRLRLAFSPETIPTEAELRIAHAQLVGWLEGLFRGIQAALTAQQKAAQAQLVRLKGAPAPETGVPPRSDASDTPRGTGQYL